MLETKSLGAFSSNLDTVEAIHPLQQYLSRAARGVQSGVGHGMHGSLAYRT